MGSPINRVLAKDLHEEVSQKQELGSWESDRWEKRKVNIKVQYQVSSCGKWVWSARPPGKYSECLRCIQCLPSPIGWGFLQESVKTHNSWFLALLEGSYLETSLRQKAEGKHLHWTLCSVLSNYSWNQRWASEMEYDVPEVCAAVTYIELLKIFFKWLAKGSKNNGFTFWCQFEWFW